MGRFWEVLGLETSSSRLPPLLVKHEVAGSGYTIRLSDLTRVWIERMNAREIRKKALNTDTSIDPSEDVGQMRLFLRCINDALEQKPGTSIDLAYDEREKNLLLKTFTPLPGSLEPLRWTMELRMEPPFALTEEMVVPLLRQQAIKNVEFASLVQQLKDKDHVIDKLIDTMQANGISLSIIFPGAAALKSASKSDPRQALCKNAKGLSRFDEQQWRKDGMHHSAQLSSFGEVVSSVFQHRSRDEQEAMSLPDYGEWWLSMSEMNSDKPEGHPKPHSPLNEGRSSIGVFEFQRQVTPRMLHRIASEQSPEGSTTRPGVENLQKLSTYISQDESTTEDEEAFAATTAAKPTTTSPQSQRNTSEALGESLAKANERDSAKQAAAPASPDGRTNSRTNQVAESKFKEDPKPWKQKGKVGRIGGKAKVNSSDHLGPTQFTVTTFQEANPDHQLEERHPKPAIRPPQSTSPAAQPQQDSQIHIKEGSSSPIPGETEKQRADRNREQIKRALDAKAAAPPKKKRRF